MSESNEQYQYDVYCNQLIAEKTVATAFAAALAWATILLFFITMGALYSVYNLKKDNLCRHVDAEYQAIVKHAAEAVVPQDGE